MKITSKKVAINCRVPKSFSQLAAVKHADLLRTGFVFSLVLVFLTSNINAQAVGDYRSSATGNWTTLATWQRWNGSAWVVPTGVNPQGYPGQYAGTGALQIQAAHTVTIGNAGITTLLMGNFTINGTLFIDGLSNSISQYSINSNNILIAAGGHIQFNNKARIVLPNNSAIIIVNRTPTAANDPNSALTGDCNNNQDILIGTVVYSVCVGGGGCIDFAQLITDGGTIKVNPDVVIGGNSFADGRVCFNTFRLTTRLSGFVYRPIGYPKYQWVQASGPGVSLFSPLQAIKQTDSTVTITVTQPGTYVFNDSVTVPLSSSCAATFVTVYSTVTIKVRPIPTSGLSITGTPVCKGNSSLPVVTFTNPDTIPITVTYNTNQTINVPASSTNSISVPTGTAGSFAYTLNNVRFTDNVPGCSNIAAGVATAVITPVTLGTHLDESTISLAAGNNKIISPTTCRLIASVATSLSGGDVTGNITGKEWIESTQPEFNGKPFVKRHYQLTPANGPTGNAIVTLYFTQQEFIDFNAVPYNGDDIPSSAADNAGIANLRVIKYSGSSGDGTGMPGSYPSGGVIINPDDNDIVWNSTEQRWEVSFSVTSFSGFIIANSTTTILPISLLQFNTSLQNGTNGLIDWKIAQPEQGILYDLQRSTDGRNFTSVHVQTGSATALQFKYTDAGLNNGKYYYRLKITDRQGGVSYGSVAVLQVGAGKIQYVVYPNPVQKAVANTLSISVSNDVLKSYKLTDAMGKIILQKTNLNVNGSIQILLPAQIITGCYYLQLNTAKGISTEKIIVE